MRSVARDGRFLRRIGFQFAARDEAAVALEQAVGHQRRRGISAQ
jgi:hypothetical protein